MGSVYRKTVTRPLPEGAELFTKAGEQFARWKPANGRSKTAPVVLGADGRPRIRTTTATYTASYRDGQGIVREVSTGCRDEGAARNILRDLERRSELVKSGVMTASEDNIADQQAVALTDHFKAYLDHLQAKGTCEKHRGNVRRNLRRVATDCGWTTLRDMVRSALDSWVAKRVGDGMSARTRNAHLAAMIAFGNWCIDNNRMVVNPFARIGKANEKADPRRKRRALTEAELGQLLLVARWRPLAEHGRDSIAVEKADKRSNWKKAELTLGSLSSAVALAKMRLAKNPELIEQLDRQGRERALVYKTLVLTGLRSGELASITLGQVDLNSPVPNLILNAADEKNGQGSSIPLRADLAEDLKEWSSDAPKPATLRLRGHQANPDPSRKLFNVPTGMIRILNRDLMTAGIPKRDDRGRTVDVHALRTTFGTLLSKGGVAPRTAQAAMRHSSIDLTMNTYTDPKLLDVEAALQSLPELSLSGELQSPVELQHLMTGTDESLVAVDVAVTPVQRGLKLSVPVIKSAVTTAIGFSPSDDVNSIISTKKPSFAGFANEGESKRAKGFEPSTYSLGSCHSTN